MKKLILLFAISSTFCLSRAFAEGTGPHWQMSCKEVTFKQYPAQLYAIGSSVAISLVVGYENAELLCSFDGPCVGLRFNSQVIPVGAAELTYNPAGRVDGFTYKSLIAFYTFKCK